MAALAIPFLVGCGTNATGPDPAPTDGTELGFSVQVVTVAIGETLHLSSLLRLPQSTPLDGVSGADWESSDGGTVSVSPDGAIQGLRNGTAVITVRSRGKTARITVEVADKPGSDPPVKDETKR
jgi:hypothetical protein